MDLQFKDNLNIPNIKQMPTESSDLQFKYDDTPRASDIRVGANVPNILHQKEFESLPEGTYINPENIQNIKEQVAENQTMWQLTKNIADRTVVGEIIGGGLATLGALEPSKLIGRWNGDKDAFEKNLFEQLGSQIQEDSAERSPLFMTLDAQQGASWNAFTDASYWANMTPSLASTLSIMLPSMGIAALAKYTGIGLKALGAGLELSKVGESVSTLIGEAAGITRPISEVAKVAKMSMGAEQGFIKSLWEAASQTSRTNRMVNGMSSKIADIFIPAIASRTMDSSREAVGRYQQYYDEYKNIFKDEPDGGDAKARQLAGEAAHRGFVESHANILFDLAEWTILGGLGKKTSALESIGQSTINKATREKLGEQAATALGVDVVETGLKSTFKSFAKTNLPAYFKSAFTEGFDETFMDFFMNEGKRKIDINAGIQQDDTSNVISRLIAHHGVAKNWDSFIGGALGGVAMAGVMDTYKGVKSKYFNDKENAFNKDIAETLAIRIKESQDLTGQFFRAKNALHSETEASILKAKIIGKVVGESYATGTTGLDIKMFENMGNLDDTQKSQLDIFKDADGNLIKDADLYSKEILLAIKDAKNIYDIEFSKTHVTDRAANTALQHSLAYSKTMISSMEKDLKALNDVKDKTINPQIEANRVNELKDLSDKYGDAVNGLYEIINKYKTDITKLNNNNSSLDGMRSMELVFIDDIKTKQQQIQKDIDESDNDTKTNMLKQRQHNLNQRYDTEVNSLEYIEDSIKTNTSKLSEIETNHKQQIKDFNEVNKIKDTDKFYSEVEKVFDNYLEANLSLNTNQSSIETLEKAIKSIKDKQVNLSSKESIDKFVAKYNSDVASLENGIINEFEDNISELKTKEEIDDLFNKLPKNITSETIKKLGELRNNKLKDIEKTNKRTKDTNVEPTVEPVDNVETTTELVDENNRISNPSSPTRSQKTAPITTDILKEALKRSNITNINVTSKMLDTITKRGDKTSISSVQRSLEIGYAKAKLIATEIDNIQQELSKDASNTQNENIVTTAIDSSSIYTIPSEIMPVIDINNIELNDIEVSNIIANANDLLLNKDDLLQSQLLTRLLLHLFNLRDGKYIVNNNISEIEKTLSLLVTKINKSLVIDNPNNIEDINTQEELMNFIFTDEIKELVPNIKTIVELAINQNRVMANLQDSMDRSIDDFEGDNTEEQLNIANNIINNILYKIGNSSVNYIDSFTSKLELFKDLIKFKQSLTGLNSVYMSVEDAIKLIKEAYVIRSISIPDNMLLEIARTIPNIFQSLSTDIALTRNNLIAEKLNYLEEQGIKPINVDYKNLTYSFEENGKLIENVSLIYEKDEDDEALIKQDKIYRHIYFEKVTSSDKNKITTITKNYTDKYILNIIKNYNPSSSITTNVDIAFNNILDENATDEDKINVIKTALQLRVGNDIILENSKDNTEDINIIHKGNIIGTIQDITTNYNNIQISDNGKTYTGFSKIIPSIESLFTSEKTEVSTELGLPQMKYGSIQILTQLEINLLKSTANNVSNTVKSDAKSKYTNIINKILNSKDGNEYLVKQIVEKFILANNSSIDENYNITAKDIESVLKILFHNVNSSFLKDDSVIEFNYFKSRIKSFDRNMKDRYNSYKRYKSIINNSKTPIAAKISKISKASILTKNTKTKLPLETSVAKINNEVPILYGTDSGINSASGVPYNKIGLGCHTLIRNTNGTLTPIPLHSNTLGNHPGQASTYVSKKIVDSVIKFQKVINNDETEESKDDELNRISIELKQSLQDLVIYKSKSNDDEYPYFHSMNVRGNTIIKFITLYGSNLIEHTIRVTGEKVFYSKIDTSNTTNLYSYYDEANKFVDSRRSEVTQFRESKFKNYNSDFHYEYNEDNIDTLENDLNTNDNKGVSNLLRHNGTIDGQFTLYNKDITTNKYKDPITNKIYDTVHDYLIDTNAVYAEIESVHDKVGDIDTDIISNVDILGNGFNFNISLDNLDTISEGNLESNPIDFISKDNILFEVSNVLNDITSELETTYGDKLSIVHYGATETQNKAREKTLITTEHTPGTIAPYEIKYTYFNKYMTTILNNEFKTNPIISLLHENIHAVLIAASDFAKTETIINPSDNAEIIADKKAKLEQLKNVYNFVNSTTNDITTSIRTQLELIRNDETKSKLFVSQFGPTNSNPNGILDNPNSIFNTIIKSLETIEKDTNKSIANFDKGETNSSAMAQEIFTYFTDPVMMLALSTIENEVTGSYTAKHENGFFANILSKLMEIYTRILKLLGININQNYTKQIGDLLNDTYIELMNITHGIKESKFEIKPTVEITTDAIKPKSTLEELLEDEEEDYSLEILDLSLDNSEIISTFANNVYDNNITHNIDDIEERIC